MSNSQATEIEVIVEKDYDNYFEDLTRSFIHRIRSSKIKRIIVEARPYQSSAVEVTYESSDTARLTYYSGLRSGFGSLMTSDIDQIIVMLSD